MLAVDGQQEPSAPLPGGDGQVAGRDEALLVRERKRDAPLERPEGGADSCEADDRIQDEIGIGRIEELRQIAADLDVLHIAGRGELVQRLRARCERDDLQIRVCVDDLERLPSDRASGPEQRDPLEIGGHVRRLTASVFRRGYARPIERSLHRYGDDVSQYGELFLPGEAGPHGVVVVIHGGFWKAAYDCSLMTKSCEDLVRQGVGAWPLEYRRVGNGGGWPETFPRTSPQVSTS